MLELKNISKTFCVGNVDKKVALSHLNLKIEDGEFVTVIGSNGSGKSTLFNMIGGTQFIDEGQILLDGKDITFLPEYRRARMIGRVFQDPMKGTAPSMTVEENLAIVYLRCNQKHFGFGISKKERELFREMLQSLKLGLEDRMKTPIGLLSGGQRQAISLLMCTMASPKLLLLDEHTAALDPATADKVLEITKRVVAEKKITTMMITHDLSSALELGDRTIMMANGNVAMDLKGAEREAMTASQLFEEFEKRNKQRR